MNGCFCRHHVVVSSEDLAIKHLLHELSVMVIYSLKYIKLK